MKKLLCIFTIFSVSLIQSSQQEVIQKLYKCHDNNIVIHKDHVTLQDIKFIKYDTFLLSVNIVKNSFNQESFFDVRIRPKKWNYQLYNKEKNILIDTVQSINNGKNLAGCLRLHFANVESMIKKQHAGIIVLYLKLTGKI